MGHLAAVLYPLSSLPCSLVELDQVLESWISWSAWLLAAAR
jgi:hypothetical protein